MTKLKTLKDIEITVDPVMLSKQDNPTINSLATFYDLKQEAKAWIKDINSDNFSMDVDEGIITERDKDTSKQAVISWIKYFFNLEKESDNKK